MDVPSGIGHNGHLQPRDYDSAGTVSLLWSRLAPVIASHPNVHVYDGWRVATAQHPEWIGPDGVHATAYGEYAYGCAQPRTDS